VPTIQHLLDESADIVEEQGGLGFIPNHEEIKRFLCVEEHKISVADRRAAIDQLPAKMLRDCGAVKRRRDDDCRLPRCQPIGQKCRHGREQRVVRGVELNSVIVDGLAAGHWVQHSARNGANEFPSEVPRTDWNDGLRDASPQDITGLGSRGHDPFEENG
jgi:hypothetical protein